MMKKHVGLLGVVAAMSAQAYDLGVSDTVKEDAYFNLASRQCSFEQVKTKAQVQQCVITGLKKQGASDAAVQFYKQHDGVITRITELAGADVGEVFYVRANSTNQMVLLNGKPQVVFTEGIVTPKAMYADKQVKQLKKQYADFTLWTSDATFVRQDKGNNQYIFAYPLKNGCHACDIGYVAHIAFRFDRKSKFVGTRWMGVKKVN